MSINSILWVKNLSEMKMVTNEETLIAEKLAELRSNISFPLLDIWSGSWKIASMAYPLDTVIHLDPLEWSNADFEIPQSHSRRQWAFFDIQTRTWEFPTLLFCHSLQYLDDKGIESVIEKIKNINPQNIILVINKNNDILWELLALFDKKWWKENGEKHFAEFPGIGYEEIHRSSIRWTFSCHTIEHSIQVIVELLLDTSIEKEEQKIEITELFKKNNISTEFNIDQWIIHYRRT